jgi:hypothetical protein
LLSELPAQALFQLFDADARAGFQLDLKHAFFEPPFKVNQVDGITRRVDADKAEVMATLVAPTSCLMRSGLRARWPPCPRRVCRWERAISVEAGRHPLAEKFPCQLSANKTIINPDATTYAPTTSHAA